MFERKFNCTIDKKCYEIPLEHLLNNTMHHTNYAMYPYEVTYQRQKYHFKDTSDIVPYFHDNLGFIIK